MYASIAKQAYHAGLTTIPVFEASELPAVPTDTQTQAHKPAVQSLLQQKHADKLAALTLDATHQDQSLMAVLITDPNIKETLPTFAPFGRYALLPYTKTTARPNLSLTDASGETLGEVLFEGYIIIESVADLPTKKALAQLTPIQPDVILDALKKHASITLKQAPITANIQTDQQMDVALKQKAGQFVNDLVLKSAQHPRLMPFINELEAIYAVFAQKLPNTTQTLDTYVQYFLNLLTQTLADTKLKLHPQALYNIGKAYTERYFIALEPHDLQLDYNQLKEHAISSMSAVVGDEAQMLITCEQIFEEVALSLSLTRLQIDTLKRFISRQSGMALNMNKIESQVLASRAAKLGLDNVANLVEVAHAALARQGHYVFDNKLHVWTGSHFQELPPTFLYAFISKYFPLRELKSQAKMTACVSMLTQSFADEDALKPTVGVNFNNCFLNRDLEAKEHHPKYGFTYQFDFAYTSDAKLPVSFLGFLNQCFSEQDEATRQTNIRLIQEAIAATLFQQGIYLQRAILLYGAGSTGKSQLLDIVRNLVPAHKCAGVQPEKWKDPASLSGLSNKLLNVCGELSETRHIDAQYFKDVVDGNPITYSTLTKETTITPTATHWFASNHLPRSRDSSDGFSRRWLIIHFDSVVEDDMRVLGLGQQIALDERDLIVAWAMSALPSANYTTAPNDFESVIARRNNNVRYFIETACVCHDLSFLKGLEEAELLKELRSMKGLSQQRLYAQYQIFVRKMDAGQCVNESEFTVRMRHLAAMRGFIHAVGADSRGRIVANYYGLKV